MAVQSPQSFYEYAGSDVLHTHTVTDENGSAVNITGFTVQAAIARRKGDTAVLSTEDSPATLTAALTTPSSGIFTLAAADTNTDGLLGTYIYYVKVVDGSSNEYPVLDGYITFKAKQL